MYTFAAKARPYFGAVVLTCAALTAGGVYSALRMPSGVYPEVTFQRIAVIARVPDRDVATMEAGVTRKLEEAVSGVLGVAQVRSKTIRGGSELSVDYNPGTDMTRAEQLTWNRIGARRSELPPNTELTVEQLTPSVFPILSVVLTGGDSPAQLRDYATYELAPRLKTIPDVLYANVTGGDVREIDVICRPDDLLANGLSAADVADQIGQLTQLQPVGLVENRPLAFQIIVNSLPAKATRIEDLVLSTRKDQPVRVRDVAAVKVLHQDRTMSIGYDQRDAVAITVFRRPAGNTVQISRDVAALLAEKGLRLAPDDPRKKPPRNVRATVVYDQAVFIRAAVDNVRDAILAGGLFSIFILLAFLRSWRATLISASAIPVTLAITLLFLHWTGESLNLMSLGGLAVAIGLIIDDTVVVVENIARHLSAVAPAGDAALPRVNAVDAASGEITGAVVGSTLTTVLVFVPLAFVAGVYGQFFASLSRSLSIAVLVSMAISLTLVPVFAAKFLAGRPMPPPGRVYGAVARAYEFVLARVLRVPWLTLALSLAAVGVGVLLYTGVPDPAAKRDPGQPPQPLVKGLETGLMPSMDEGAFILDYWAPSGSPLAETERKVREIEKILSKNPDVQAYLRRTGSENGLFATQTSRGDLTIVLRDAEDDPVSRLTRPVRPPLAELEAELKKQGRTLAGEREAIRAKYRRRPLKKVMEEVEDEVKDAFSEHQLKIETIQIMEDELNDLSGANKPVEVKLFGPDQNRLRGLAEEVAETLEKKGKGRGFKEVNSNVRAGNPDLMIRLDGFYSDKLGLKPDAVARQLKAVFQGQIATQIPESSLRITDVRVRYPDAIRFGADPAAPGKGYFDRQRVLDQWILLPEAKAPVTVPGAPGVPLAGPARAVPLRGLGDVKAVRTPDEQYRENQQPAIFVTAELNEEEAGLGSVVADARAWMTSDVHLPAGYRWELGGHYVRMKEAFRSLLVVMVVAVLLVFITLAYQFRSVVLPLLIFLTQPLSLVSGLFALWVTGTPLNVSSYMGAILLVGLDMKNGILLVEYIQKLRADGVALRPALLQAGRTRFRPILMTSLAAILGMVPLALGLGPGAQMQQPLAVMVIGGLTANMLFTRMVIPVGYLVLERRTEAAAVVPALVTLTPAPPPAGANGPPGDPQPPPAGTIPAPPADTPVVAKDPAPPGGPV